MMGAWCQLEYLGVEAELQIGTAVLSMLECMLH